MGSRVWAPKPVYRSLKPPGYGPDNALLRLHTASVNKLTCGDVTRKGLR